MSTLNCAVSTAANYSRKRVVARLMREAGLIGVHRRRKTGNTERDPARPHYADRMRREFTSGPVRPSDHGSQSTSPAFGQRLEFYFVHQFDADTPIEETLRALDGLVRRGLILYPAVSNWAAWQIMKALGVSAREHLARFELIQPMYNLAKRQAEVEILPLARSEQVGVIPYSPLGGGLLTGKYSSGDRPGRGRLVENRMYAKRYGDAKYVEVAERFTAYARDHDVHPVTLAVAWVGSHPAVTAPIVGARDAEQLEPSLAAASFGMTAAMRDEVTALSPAVAPAHDRSEEL